MPAIPDRLFFPWDVCMKKKTLSPYIVALLLFIGGVGYLVGTGIAENKVYFADVAEALEMPKDQQQSARLFGTVKASTVTENGATRTINFLLEDQKQKALTLGIVYQGSMPDNFQDGAEVIVEGQFAEDHKYFQAKVLMTKCPSKYEKENRT